MSYTCPRCLRTSQNPADEQNRYCGNCHVFEQDYPRNADFTALVAVRPVNVAGMPMADLFQPSIDHVQILCDVCQDTCWIGPKQLYMAISAGSRVMCYRCLIEAAKTNPDVADALDNVIGLDPHADARPRRPE